MFRRRAEDQIRGLAERHIRALAVDLGGGRDEDQLLLLVRVLEDDFGAVHVGFDRVHRLLDDQLHADGGREVKHDVAAIDQLREQRFVRDRVDRVGKTRAALEMGDVVDRSGRQVVEHDDLVPIVEQPLGEMRSDETGTAGDERLHARIFPF